MKSSYWGRFRCQTYRRIFFSAAEVDEVGALALDEAADVTVGQPEPDLQPGDGRRISVDVFVDDFVDLFVDDHSARLDVLPRDRPLPKQFSIWQQNIIISLFFNFRHMARRPEPTYSQARGPEFKCLGQRNVSSMKISSNRNVGAAVVIQKCGTEILQIFLMDQENTSPQSNRVDS